MLENISNYFIYIVCAIALMCTSNSYAWKFEADVATANNTATDPNFTSQSFRQTFDVVPLVFILPNDQGGDAATIRIQSVSTTGFVFSIVEPGNDAGAGTGNNGAHVAMDNIPYIAVEPGVHTLSDGTIIEAGYISTSRFQSNQLAGSSWESLFFRGNFASAPTLLTQIQTMNNETVLTTPGPFAPFPPPTPWLTSTVRLVTAGGSDIALDRSETIGGSITTTENIGYLAIESSYNGTFADNASNTIEVDSFISGNVIDGWDNGCDTVSFPNISSAQRIAIAKKSTRNGGDGGWLRRCSLANGSIGLTVDEDIANDSERGHIDEQASVLVFDSAFDAELNDIADIAITKDDSSLTYTPGGSATYTITVTNNGDADAKNILVADTFPDGVSVDGNWSCTTTTTNDPCVLCVPRGLSSCVTGSVGGTAATGTGNISQAVDLPVGSSVVFSVPVNFSSNMADF